MTWSNDFRRRLSDEEAVPILASVEAMAEVQDRMHEASYERRSEAFTYLVARAPQRRETMRSKVIDLYRFTPAEAQEFDRLRSNYRYTAFEAADIIVKGRRPKSGGS